MSLPSLATPWQLPGPDEFPAEDLVCIGADLAPGTILAGYMRGLFPMHVGPGVLGWWSPDPRGIVPLESFSPSRSLRRSLKSFEIRFDTAFEDVVAGCADPARPRGWISSEIRDAYVELHRLGWAHSVEAWHRDELGTPFLAGGLYGVAIGGFFAAESKFHRKTDASKAALAALVARMRERGASLLDVQWKTPHLERLGAIEISRSEYIVFLNGAARQDIRLFD